MILLDTRQPYLRHGSMYFIKVGAFINLEGVMRNSSQEDTITNRIKVLEYCDDEAKIKYAILSHRWTRQEVNHVEITGLAKMGREDRNEIRQRDGYQKIYYSCLQAKEDGYEWLWVDTCCIDKRSSAELSEAINSMYRWYENSTVCYVYLHDVHGSSLPTEPDMSGYPDRSKEWPEWFSRGWTLQEMIAPNNVRFFNKSWIHIGDKKAHAHTLATITGVPEHILTDGLSSNRPCIAQIMSWAAKRMTTRVEDRAYSLLGLLDVNMPMLYGEGKKAFHRLQLEIIRMSNDQSIFAWSWSSEVGRTGSILADCPSSFGDCSGMELMKSDDFTEFLKDKIREEDKDCFGVFPITNRGIQIWLLLSPYGDSTSVFKARLPCRSGTSGSPVTIDLALWESNYYRYFTSRSVGPPGELAPQFRQVYLRYQDTPHHDATFEIDDSAVINNGFTYCGSFPSPLTEKMLTLTSDMPPHIFIYSDSNTRRHFAVGFGQCFGQDWVHFTCQKPMDADNGQPIWEYAVEAHKEMLIGGPEHARSMAKARSGKRHSRLCIMQVHLPKSEWIVRTSCIVWESSRGCGIKFEVFSDHGVNDGQDKWTGFDVEVSRFFLVYTHCLN